SSIGVALRHPDEVRSQKKLPWNSLVPDRVAATIAALLIWSNSALEFWVVTLYSPMADCGNGLPGLEACPATPRRSGELYCPTPSMNTLTLLAPCAPERSRVLPPASWMNCTPGTVSAKARKLRVPWGRDWICCCDT